MHAKALHPFSQNHIFLVFLSHHAAVKNGISDMQILNSRSVFIYQFRYQFYYFRVYFSIRRFIDLYKVRVDLIPAQLISEIPYDAEDLFISRRVPESIRFFNVNAPVIKTALIEFDNSAFDVIYKPAQI